MKLSIFRILPAKPIFPLLAMLAAAGIAVPNANAQYWSTDQLMQWLEDDLNGKNGGYNSGLVTGYIIGVADAFEGITSCVPGGVTVRETKQVVHDYVSKHPDTLGKSPELVMMDALSGKWPCKKRKGP